MSITYNLDGELRRVRERDFAGKVGLVLVSANIQVGLDNLDTLKAIQSLNLVRLLVVNVKVARQATRAHTSLTLEGNPQRLIAREPGVIGGKGIHVLNVDILLDVDGLLLLRGRLGKVQLDKGAVRQLVLEVHVTREGADLSGRTAGGGDFGLNLHAQGVALGVDDLDALDLERRFVDLLLGELGNTDEDAEILV